MVGMLNMRSSVWADCLNSPLKNDLIDNLWGSWMAFLEVITGPMGVNLLKDYALACWLPDLSGCCQYREDTPF
jgi:hypothetical protein